jgi:lipoyl(octanoyl) transferase
MLDIVNAGIADHPVDYMHAWELQKNTHKDVVAGTRPNTLIFLEHPAVYTAGKRTEDTERPTNGTPVINVDRGGKITWHGPGQLVGYPIVKLNEPMDVVAYVRTIESLLISSLAEFGITGERVEGRSGVWVKDGLGYSKIAAIGIRISESVSMHGFSVNCDNSLEPYSHIIACGIADAGATTMTAVTGTTIKTSDVIPVITRHFTTYFEDSYVR